MLVADLIFDLLLFGALLLGLTLDNLFPFSPALHGVASLIAVGLAAYVAAQDFAHALDRRGAWTQESLATAVTLSSLGFLYYFGRNNSDFILLALSITLMMSALMLLIAAVGTVSAMWQEKSGKPLAGFLFTVLGALGLGGLSGLLIIVWTGELPIALKFGLLVVGAVLWKLRDIFKPAKANTQHETTTPEADAIEHPGASWTLMPTRGRLLDRFLPVLVLGALAFVLLKQGNAVWMPGAPAVASNNEAQNSSVAPTSP
jgi:hypothetical protein